MKAIHVNINHPIGSFLSDTTEVLRKHRNVWVSEKIILEIIRNASDQYWKVMDEHYLRGKIRVGIDPIDYYFYLVFTKYYPEFKWKHELFPLLNGVEISEEDLPSVVSRLYEDR